MKKGFVASAEKFESVGSLRSFTLIGDPGCDGLGAAAMSVFAKALDSGPAELFIVAGDLVPFASRRIYENVKSFVDRAAERPVRSLCGNHDAEFYEEFFGPREYALVAEKLVVVALDDSKRKFSDSSLALLQEAFERFPSFRFVLLFHIPPPNRFSFNSIPQEEWEKLRAVFLPFRDKIECFACGHVHSFFKDEVDGIPLIVTGGGGARIEAVNPEVDKANAGHHVVDFAVAPDGSVSFSLRSLDDVKYEKELADPALKRDLETAFAGECAAMFKYAFRAEEAETAGKLWLAKLFRALSHSEYFHARNHFCSLGGASSPLESVKAGVESESYEINVMYKDFMERAEAKGHALAACSFFDSLTAEKVHLGLLEEATDLLKSGGEPEPSLNYYTCGSCGCTFRSSERPGRCPVCGAPRDKILQEP